MSKDKGTTDLTGLTGDSVNQNSRADLTTSGDLSGFSNLTGLNKTTAPKLRFPEFRNAPEWENQKLEEISVPIVERVGDKKLTPISISAGIGFVPQIEKFGRDISGNQYRLYTLVKDGDFVYNKGNSIKFPQGCVYILRNWGEVAAPNVFICFRLKDGYVNDFFQYCFEKNTHGAQLKKHITSGARSNGLLNISKENFFGIHIPTPSTAEQQKIADCLTSLDELIAAERAQLEALKTYKKGLLQNLFPAEGEQAPKLRFPEFQSAGEWEERKLGELADVSKLAGYEFTKYIVYKDRGHLIALRGLNIKNNTLDLKDVKYIDGSDISKLSRSKLFVDDLMFTYIGTIGEVALIEENDKFYLAPNVSRIRINKNKLNAKFILQYFNLPHFKEKEISKYISSSSQPALTMENVRKFIIKIPTLPEQEKIAQALTSIDEAIAGQSQRVAGLAVHKQGLLQGLFP